ncbi:MAG: EAL domain-containing protein [Pseudomonadota bacterium]
MRIHHRQRLDAQAELQHTFQAMPIGLFTLDLRGRFLSANPALHTMLGVDDVMSPGRNTLAQYFNIGSWEQLHDIVHVDGDSELQLQRNRAPDSTGEIQHFMVKATLARGKIEGSLQDVTQQLKATEDLRFMANNDPLTKVYNRRGIEHALADAVVELAEGKPLALAYLDLDRFKLINDLYGHATGDEVLKQVCKRVGGMLSGGQHMGRVGGDEFVIVLPDTSIVLASWICRGIVNSISNAAFCIDDKAFQVRGSIGLIEVSPGAQIRDAMATADRACRAAKSGNHGSLVVYEKNAPAFRELEAELDLVERLSGGVAPEGLFVEMQPIMSLKKPFESLNFEVLLRMRDHDGSLIPTWRVITAAENSGQISVIDRWVLSTTLAWLDTNLAVLARTQFVCMNLSGASLNDERFIQDAFVMLSENLHVANRLCIEITESVALHDLDNTRRFIDKVRSYGVKVGLDDFGAGYTSFSYLRELPADILKIDGNFIVDMNAHPANIAIVEAIVSLAMNLGMKTIAEWAEDASTVQTLAEIGVDYVQGFVVARPQSPDVILAAQSSASFITEAGLMEFVQSLGTTRILPQDRRKPTRSEDLH